MDDYKRMLLAVIVASLFIYLWTTVFVRPPERTPEGRPGTVADTTQPGIEPVITREAEPGTTPGIPPAVPPETQAAAPPLAVGEGRGPDFQVVTSADFDTGPAVVETGLCHGEILPLGGELASWRLKGFLSRTDEDVDLVNSALGIESDLGVELLGEDGRTSFEGVPFGIEELDVEDAVVARILKLTAADTAGASLTKTYTFYQDEYFFDVEVVATGFDSEGGLGCAMSWRHGLPITESNERTDTGNFASVSLLGEEFAKEKLKDFNKEPSRTHEGNVIWSGVRSKYFIAAMIPTHAQGRVAYTWGSPDNYQVGTQVLVPMASDRNGAATARFRVYAGPIELDRLRALGVGLERVAYQRFRFMAPLNHFILSLMTWTYKFTPNYGVVIIIISALTKLVFYPLTKSSLKSMAAMRKLQPEVEAIKKKYKGDPKKMNQAQMELFRKHKVNPMGGCLPILVQMPIFFALYNVLVDSVQFRRAPFVLWIDDLSAPDTLFYVGTFAIHVLPIVMAVTQFLQPQMGGADPRQAMMTKIMPVFLLVIFYGLPSGLVLYWTVNNVMTALQQYLMNRAEASQKAIEAAPSPGGGKKARRSNLTGARAK